MARLHHLCLISDQLIPNYLPTLDKNLKPEVVTLVVSPQKEALAKRLRRILERNQITVMEDLKLEDVVDIAKIQKQIEDWINENDNGDELMVNVTGGNKPMAIAAQEVFRIMGKNVFYVDIATDRVEWINRMDGTPCREAIYLEHPIKIKRYFELVDTKVCEARENNRTIKDDWKRFATQAMVENIKKWGASLGILNKLANDAEKDDQRGIEDALNRTKDPLWEKLDRDLLLELEGNGLITSTESFEFCNSEARAFCNGLWLEEMVFCLFKENYGLKKDQCLANVKVDKLDTKINDDSNNNELDVAVVSRNSLYVIECKTRNMRQNKNENVVSDAIYKLSYLQNTFGLRSNGIIISARPVRKRDKERAEAARITILDNLTELEQQLGRILKLSKCK